MIPHLFNLPDVVIYRTRADRLHRDLFQFLGDASKAYLEHFTPELRAASHRCQIPMASMGPAVIVFHETTHTLPLGEGIVLHFIGAEHFVRTAFPYQHTPSVASPFTAEYHKMPQLHPGLESKQQRSIT